MLKKKIYLFISTILVVSMFPLKVTYANIHDSNTHIDNAHVQEIRTDAPGTFVLVSNASISNMNTSQPGHGNPIARRSFQGNKLNIGITLNSIYDYDKFVEINQLNSNEHIYLEVWNHNTKTRIYKGDVTAMKKGQEVWFVYGLNFPQNVPLDFYVYPGDGNIAIEAGATIRVFIR